MAAGFGPRLCLFNAMYLSSRSMYMSRGTLECVLDMRVTDALYTIEWRKEAGTNIFVSGLNCI